MSQVGQRELFTQQRPPLPEAERPDLTDSHMESKIHMQDPHEGTAMTDLHALSLSPFVPSGKDYDGSRRLFADLGFDEVWESGGYAGFRNGAAQFILQRFDDERFAGNFMVRLDVPDLDLWWAAVSQKQLEKAYPGFRIKPPEDFPWGREVNFIDLAGVCWHVGQPSR